MTVFHFAQIVKLSKIFDLIITKINNCMFWHVCYAFWLCICNNAYFSMLFHNSWMFDACAEKKLTCLQLFPRFAIFMTTQYIIFKSFEVFLGRLYYLPKKQKRSVYFPSKVKNEKSKNVNRRGIFLTREVLQSFILIRQVMTEAEPCLNRGFFKERHPLTTRLAASE